MDYRALVQKLGDRTNQNTQTSELILEHRTGHPNYYNNKRQGELDFVIEQNGEVLPLEVKSGKDYERHKALTNVMNSTTYQISKAYVLCNDNVKKVGKITYLPIYMLMFIKNEQKLPTQYTLDLSGLV